MQKTCNLIQILIFFCITINIYKTSNKKNPWESEVTVYFDSCVLKFYKYFRKWTPDTVAEESIHFFLYIFNKNNKKNCYYIIKKNIDQYCSDSIVVLLRTHIIASKLMFNLSNNLFFFLFEVLFALIYWINVSVYDQCVIS